MKARIRQSWSGMWYGEVYADWFFGGVGWNKVTAACLTEFGAKIELNRWIRKNRPKEFEI